MTIDLFRIKILARAQQTFFEADREDLLKNLILLRPRGPRKSRTIWAIDNVVEIDMGSMYFRIGRVSRKTLPRLTDVGFNDLEVDNDPNTEVFVDTALGIVAIKRNSALAESTRTVANYIVRLFEGTEHFDDFGVDLVIESISEVENFIDAIRRAYRIKYFNFTFTKPNPHDTNALIRGFEQLSAEANARKGGGYLAGQELEKGTIEELARSLAASGDDAGAEIIPEKGARPERKRLKEDIASVTADRDEGDNWRNNIMAKVRIAYQNLRSGTRDE